MSSEAQGWPVFFPGLPRIAGQPSSNAMPGDGAGPAPRCGRGGIRVGVVHTDVQQLEKCIGACNSRMQACEPWLTACLKDPDAGRGGRCMQLFCDCADMGALASRAMFRSSDFAGDICRVWADICDARARFQDEHCQECARECRGCAVSAGNGGVGTVFSWAVGRHTKCGRAAGVFRRPFPLAFGGRGQAALAHMLTGVGVPGSWESSLLLRHPSDVMLRTKYPVGVWARREPSFPSWPGRS